jgi:formylglycine-generating enzyme required for sulfatase activity
VDDQGLQEGPAFTNSVGMKFAWIEPGTFWMGSPDGNKPPGVPAEEEREDDETPHEVTLIKGYHLGKHLVTQSQWEQVMGQDANRSRFKGQDEDEKKKLPVDNVTWFDCVDFCIKLSKLEKREPHYRLTDVELEDGSIKAAKVEMLAGGTGYRLPTEAEWEYACRAGTGTAFWWGNSITTDQANYDGNYIYGKDGKQGEYRKKTTPVDFFPANPWHLHDMHGNLWQWCQDWYGKDHYGKSDKKDPKGPDSGDDRVLRGGSWGYYPRHCRAAIRGWVAPASRDDDYGCRALLLPSPSALAVPPCPGSPR